MTRTSTTRNRCVLALTAIAALVVLALAGPAIAAAAPPPSKAVGKAERARNHLLRLDVVQRLAQALPIPVAKGLRPSQRNAHPDGPTLTVTGTEASSTSSAATSGALATTEATLQNGAWPGAYDVNPNRQVGKLYFDTQLGPGEDWNHCSATSVNSEDKSLVVTAGHCVFNPDPDKNGVVNGNGYWYENVHFCPGYENGCKLGVWFARRLFTTPSWFYGFGTTHVYDWRDDMAIVLVSPNATKGYLVNSVGGQGIAFNRATGLQRYAFGYPVSDWRWPEYSYTGEDLIYCPAVDVNVGAGKLRIPCTMTGGASGGPWLTSPTSNWLGYVNSVDSHKSWGGAYMGGPYFGSAESDLFQYARAR